MDTSDGDDTKGRELWELCQQYTGFLKNIYNKNRNDKNRTNKMHLWMSSHKQKTLFHAPTLTHGIAFEVS